ncbi:MAG: S8 family peptidase [Nitrososphaerota archaeon]
MTARRKNSVLFFIILLLTLFASLMLTQPSSIQPAQAVVILQPGVQPTNNQVSKIDPELASLMNGGDPNREVEMIVTFQGVTSMEGAELFKSLEAVTVLRTYTIISGVLVKAPIGMAANMASLDFVKSVTYNREIKIHSTAHSVLQATTTYSAGIDQIGARRLHELGINGTGVKVAVLDTGINTHEALPSSKIIYNRSFVKNENDPADFNGHGTHVAGIIAGYCEGRYVGVAPGALLLNIKVLNKDGKGDLNYLIEGIQDAVDNGAKVISISAGALINDPNDPVCLAVNNATLRGVVVVAAAGNDGPDSGTINAPAEAAFAICVGAVTSSNYIPSYYIPSFSSRGPTRDHRTGVTLVAPGVNIISLSYNNTQGYVAMSGTSQATPHVSGAVALLLSYNPNLTPHTVKAALMATAVDLDEDTYAQGCGLVNVSAAYELLCSGKVPVAVSPPRIRLTSFGSQLLVTVNFTIVGGLARDNSLSNVKVEVEGGISSLITLSPGGPFDLNNTHKFVTATIYIPSSYMAPFFSGSIKFVNSNNETIAEVKIQGVGPTVFLLLYLLSQEASSFYFTMMLVILVVPMATAALLLAFAIYKMRRAPPEEMFPPEPVEPGPPLGGEPYRWPYDF